MIIFISGTGTGIGKTFINIKINQALIKKGYKICSLKPIETGVIKQPQDAILHKKNQSNKLKLDDICFYTFSTPSSPFVADINNIIDINLLKQKVKSLEKQYDIVLIEGAGGLFVPIKKNYFFIDLIKELESICFLICSDKLGCINEILVHREALKNRNIKFISIINLFNESSFLEISYPFLKDLDNNFIFQMQEKELLDYILLLKN
ncbi:dethiobiotin synthase [Helicobacter sp. MIT 14-3879]|uniref:dethiobiotin synthase n=1 Tax=Helicobacter sp. MIT 14-3879 TaxID=2040649 RepID=UPI000E1FA017|nr:dethiobiotin synthase [Helicobacter sp. MIT 14-3879]RDU64096.1 dethiobiotin synthase [Helicobacter sp. MIT 14-3879]